MIQMARGRSAAIALAVSIVASCGGGARTASPPAPQGTATAPPASTPPPPTPAEAEAFIKQVSEEFAKLDVDAARASWVKSTYITDDTEKIESQAQERLMEFLARKIREARRFEGLTLSSDLARQFHLLKYSAE